MGLRGSGVPQRLPSSLRVPRVVAMHHWLLIHLEVCLRGGGGAPVFMCVTPDVAPLLSTARWVEEAHMD
jgi:hypothetical protein